MSSKNHCSRCLLRQDLCLCHRAPLLRDGVHELKLVLLTHADEFRKVTNTGRLLETALPQCEVWEWQRTEFESQWREFLASQTRTPILLFPADEASSTSTLELEIPSTENDRCTFLANHVFVLIDATWQQAKKILRQSCSLQTCARLSLSLSQESQYTLRRNQTSGNLSTVETGCGLLRELGLTADTALLEQYFLQFLRHSEANRSGYALNENDSIEDR